MYPKTEDDPPARGIYDDPINNGLLTVLIKGVRDSDTFAVN